MKKPSLEGGESSSKVSKYSASTPGSQGITLRRDVRSVVLYHQKCIANLLKWKCQWKQVCVVTPSSITEGNMCKINDLIVQACLWITEGAPEN